MALLTAPFPQFDPLGLARLTQSGLMGAMELQQRNAAMDQSRTDMGMKLLAQGLGEINDSLWKKRELERRKEEFAAKLELERKGLEMEEKRLEQRDEEFDFLHDPDRNKLLGSQIAENEAQRDKALSDIETPEEKKAKDAKALADLQAAQADALLKGRDANYAQAASLKAAAEGALDVLPHAGLTDLGSRALGLLPNNYGGPMESILGGIESNRADITSVKAQAEQAMKENVAIPKPGTVRPPVGPKPLSQSTRQLIVQREMAPTQRAISENQNALDKARSELNKIESEKAQALGAEMNAALAKADPTHAAAVSKPFEEAKKKIMVSFVTEAGSSRNMTIEEAEAELLKMRQNAKVKQFEFEQKLDVPIQGATDGTPLLPTPAGAPPPGVIPGDTAASQNATVPEPLPPPQVILNDVMKGIPDVVRAKIMPLLTLPNG
jgi:hypothetical protein